MPLRVKAPTILRVIVLAQSGGKARRLSNVDPTLEIQEDIYGVQGS
jgi:hypothetical protein